MRGRTNITQRNVPTVHGNIIKATVSDGNVEVGDFVEYDIEHKQEQFVTSVGTEEREFIKLDNDLLLVFNDSEWILISVKNGLNVLSRMGNVRRPRVNRDGEIFSIESYPTYYVKELVFIVYKVIENKFVFQKRIHLNVEDIENYISYGFDIIDNCLLLQGHNKETYDKSKFFIHTFEYNGNELLFKKTNEFICDIGNGSFLPLSRYTKIMLSNDGNAFALFGTTKGNFMFLLNVNNYNVIEVDNYEIGSTNFYGGINAFNGEIVKGGSWSDSWNNITSELVVRTFSDNGIISISNSFYFWNEIKDDENISKAISIGYNIASADVSCQFVKDNKIYFIIKPISFKDVRGIYLKTEATEYCYVVCCEISKVDGSYNYTNYVKLKNNSGNAMFFEDDNGNVWMIIGSVIYNMYCYNGRLYIGKKQNTVKKYSGMDSIGFAKTGGNVGDEIQIYVPSI